MRVVTWNVNRFNGTRDWYHEGDLEISERLVYAQKIVEKLKTIIETEDDIAILQEVPFNRNEWEGVKEFEGWGKLLEKDFGVHAWFNEEYKKQEEDRRKDFNYEQSNNFTIAITMKQSRWRLRTFDNRFINFGEEDGMHNWANRYIEMENGKISLLGIHVTAYDEKKEKEGQSYDIQWKQIRSAAGATEGAKFTFIVGDFNTNDLKYKSNTNMQDLEGKDYVRVIKNDIITNNRECTSIDNIFIDKSFGFDISNVQAAVIDSCLITQSNNYSVRYSDHNICICEL